ncbi:hypothetical protein [Pseudooctadecabacter jejudonensis]|uniref:Uncharacterized protein n=1 Tax=Pseudooctadecabacter jejudonensis TaxID=1391910 RepID=A0A1Y5R9F5_9RHOB|nr:hypothetical protein [Pseudooctadecabacter jejudonensis]SLN12263.1 hypothetical protein PSJ8397_00158 [Pseudooctadecabacter jejudonensis]
MADVDTQTGCDPALLSCITAQEIQLALPFIAVVTLAVGIWGLIRHERRKHAGLLAKRGSPPSQDETILYAGERHVFGPGNFDASRPYRVSRDPQVQARAMMPQKHRKSGTHDKT